MWWEAGAPFRILGFPRAALGFGANALHVLGRGLFMDLHLLSVSKEPRVLPFGFSRC